MGVDDKDLLGVTYEKLIGIEPLPEEKYPRIIEKGKPDKGYYIALGLVLSVWMITPLSWCGYLDPIAGR
jgi:hypothetical protein